VSTQWEVDLTDLVTRRSRALVGYGYALCGDPREAEDLVQDALVKVFRRFRRPEATASTVYPLEHGDADADDAKRASTEAYVRRTMLTLYLDRRRRRTTWARIGPMVATTASVPGPASGASARADVVAALRALSPRQRACVVFRFYDDYTVPQIAAALGTSEGTIKRYLAEAMQSMRDALVPEGELR
jgi:RNA polymerase sigma factor (sigma-70 family)